MPISAIQLMGMSPPDTIVTSRAGDRGTGYPEISFNYTSTYTFTGGVLKGLRLGGTVNARGRRGDYYFYPGRLWPDGATRLFSRPTLVLVDGTFGYERRFGRFS